MSEDARQVGIIPSQGYSFGKKQNSREALITLEWLSLQAEKKGQSLRTAFDPDGEKKISVYTAYGKIIRLPVDGYNPFTKEIIQYQGNQKSLIQYKIFCDRLL
jgi:hypothetical protein